MRIDFDRMTVICLGQFHVLESSLSVFDVRISLITILRFKGSIDLKKFAQCQIITSEKLQIFMLNLLLIV